MSCFMLPLSDGQIQKVRHSSSSNPPGVEKMVRITDPAEMLLLKRPEQCLYVNRKVVLKPQVTLVASKEVIKADGQDISSVSLQGLPEEFATVAMQVGSETVALPRNETLEISTNTVGAIPVVLKEPLLLAEPITIIGEL